MNFKPQHFKQQLQRRADKRDEKRNNLIRHVEEEREKLKAQRRKELLESVMKTCLDRDDQDERTAVIMDVSKCPYTGENEFFHHHCDSPLYKTCRPEDLRGVAVDVYNYAIELGFEPTLQYNYFDHEEYFSMVVEW